MTLQTERIRTLDQIRAFVEGSEAVDFTGTDRESVYEFVRQALVWMDYEGLGKSDKRLVRRYLAKVTGLLRTPPVGSASIARPSVSRTGAVALRRAPSNGATRGPTFGNWRRWMRRWARCRGRPRHRVAASLAR